MCRSSNCIVSGQAGVFRENIDEGSVSGDCDTTNMMNFEEGPYLLSSDDEDEPSEYLKNINFRNKLRVWAIEKT